MIDEMSFNSKDKWLIFGVSFNQTARALSPTTKSRTTTTTNDERRRLTLNASSEPPVPVFLLFDAHYSNAANLTPFAYTRSSRIAASCAPNSNAACTITNGSLSLSQYKFVCVLFKCIKNPGVSKERSLRALFPMLNSLTLYRSGPVWFGSVRFGPLDYLVERERERGNCIFDSKIVRNRCETNENFGTITNQHFYYENKTTGARFKQIYHIIRCFGVTGKR